MKQTWKSWCYPGKSPSGNRKLSSKRSHQSINRSINRITNKNLNNLPQNVNSLFYDTQKLRFWRNMSRTCIFIAIVMERKPSSSRRLITRRIKRALQILQAIKQSTSWINSELCIPPQFHPSLRKEQQNCLQHPPTNKFQSLRFLAFKRMKFQRKSLTCSCKTVASALQHHRWQTASWKLAANFPCYVLLPRLPHCRPTNAFSSYDRPLYFCCIILFTK